MAKLVKSVALICDITKNNYNFDIHDESGHDDVKWQIKKGSTFTFKNIYALSNFIIF